MVHTMHTKQNQYLFAFALVLLATVTSSFGGTVVFYEKGFDGIHTKNIYRLDEVQKFEGMVAPQNVALSMYPMAPTLKAEFPEVLNVTRVRQNEKVNMGVGENRIVLPKVFFVDSTFLQIFDFELLKGNPKLTALIATAIIGAFTMEWKLITDSAELKQMKKYEPILVENLTLRARSCE